MSDPRYPKIHVRVASQNPSALVSALRLALRQAGVAKAEIADFSQQAMGSDSPSEAREVCSRWARIDFPISTSYDH